ncbi:nitroreductase family protein [Pontiella sulfatireligans]|uniref:nitroreductase family protein n=1 Tax=Pontiella sulfatireligans TaxID=2750658 RepID=UPI001443FECD|nr:nitroreductase family protein [Pontiella sulfatireligans]
MKIYLALAKMRDKFRCWKDYQSDFKRFWHYSQTTSGGGESLLGAEILASSHIIERGLSLPEPRLGYGKEKIEQLIKLVQNYVSSGFDLKALAYTNALDILKAYADFHREKNHDLGDVGGKIYELVCGKETAAGYEKIALSDWMASAKGDFKSCAMSRYSVRAYGSDPVPKEKIKEALEIARKTPSVCNRQSWKAYWIQSEDAKKRLLNLQNGHRGFGYQVDSFIIVTTDLCTFYSDLERNQSFIDGGLYTMSILYSLHYVGLGACTLNWCVRAKTDKCLKTELDIPQNENIIVVIAVGSLPDEVRAAKSVRKTVRETLVVR